jgi:hypothetical protein
MPEVDARGRERGGKGGEVRGCQATVEQKGLRDIVEIGGVPFPNGGEEGGGARGGRARVFHQSKAQRLLS